MQLVCWLGPESLSAQTCNFLGSLCTFPEPRSLPRFPSSYEVKHQESVQCDRALMTYLEKSNNSVCQSSGFLHDTVFLMQSVGLTEWQIYEI